MKKQDVNGLWEKFTTQYNPFIQARARSLADASNGLWNVDDAIQELHVAVWTAVCDPNFDSSHTDWTAWVYKRVCFKTLKMIRHLGTNKNSKLRLQGSSFECNSSMTGAVMIEEGAGPTVHPENDAITDGPEGFLEARSWIEKAIKVSDSMPVNYRAVVTAYLQPEEGLWDFANSRRDEAGNNAAKYDFASHKDLVEYTGNPEAARDLATAMVYLEKEIGNPVGPRAITKPHRIPRKLIESSRSQGFKLPGSILDDEKTTANPAPKKKCFQNPQRIAIITTVQGGLNGEKV